MCITGPDYYGPPENSACTSILTTKRRLVATTKTGRPPGLLRSVFFLLARFLHAAHLPHEALPRLPALRANPEHPHRARAESRAQILRKQLPIASPNPSRSRRLREDASPKAVRHGQAELHVRHVPFGGKEGKKEG